MQVLFTTIQDFHNDEDAKKFLFENLNLVLEKTVIQREILRKLRHFLLGLRQELVMVIETDYVDKVYRDSYYTYFSTKLKRYARNCIRVSFFEPTIQNESVFFSLDNKSIQDAYRGFLVIRPLVKCIGRNAIDVKAKIQPNDSILIRKAEIPSSCLGVKLKVRAFPHASQDAELMTCAETTIWEMLEYFGRKYSSYNLVLPTDILKSIQSSSFERQIPSKGLRLEQISLALQQQGFGCKIYQEVGNPKFKELLTCYIESGIPLAVVMECGGERHAVVCIGRPKINRKIINQETKGINKNYYFWNKNINKFVFNDDNCPCYEIRDYSEPANYLGKGKITHFIVPLYKKIYLPAEQAIDKSNFLIEREINAPEGSYIRTFLTSSRSFREYIKKNKSLTPNLKMALLLRDLPKFIWITEITYNQMDFINEKVNAIIVLDATGITTADDPFLSLIFILGSGKLTIFNAEKHLFENFLLTLPTIFDSFDGNLK